jgi:hypothetical protein
MPRSPSPSKTMTHTHTWFWSAMDISGVSSISEPSIGDWNRTPSSVISARCSSDTCAGRGGVRRKGPPQNGDGAGGWEEEGVCVWGGGGGPRR